MNALVYVDMERAFIKGKMKVAKNEKRKKNPWVFFLYKYSKFWSVFSEFKFERKLFILEVCAMPANMRILEPIQG